MERKFPDWNELYKNQPAESMPWFSSTLDPDLGKALKENRIGSGRFLDLGTGPGTQAMNLAMIGFSVTGSDISENAIKRARELYRNVEFVVDNILHTKLAGKFDYIFDRGCFHTLAPENRPAYI